MRFFFYIEFIALALLLICLLCMGMSAITMGRKKRAKLEIPKSEKKTKFAILIPARDESRVIESSLNALYASNYPRELYDVYVIVETMEDPTVEICKKFEGATVFLRTNLENKGKGHALDECVNYIFENNDVYDAFFVLDADNILCPDFLSKMSDAYQAGYEAGCGKRNNKDWNSSWVSSSSCLIFSLINGFQNKRKTALGASVTFTGTGFFVNAKILRKLGGWKFFSLTEDYEFSTFVMCNGIKNCYIDDAIFYDEQPHTMWQSIKQRTRWIKGYFSVRFGYRKMKREFSKNNPKNSNMIMMKLSSLPMLVGVIDIIVYLVASIVGCVVSAINDNGYAAYFLIRIGLVLGLIYLIMLFMTVWIFAFEGDVINITRKNKVKTIFLHPIFLMTYVFAAIRAVYAESKWEVIEHTISESVEA